MMAFDTSSPQDTTTLLIEGWRGLNHSYSLINQHQILELMQIPNLRLFHYDLPYFNPGWSRDRNGSNFPSEIQSRIDSIPTAGAESIDCVYRIGFPFVCGDPTEDRRTLTFMVTEFGLSPNSFTTFPGSEGEPNLSFLTKGSNLIITPSNWARDRIADYGFPLSHIAVLPHGVDRTVFYPLDDEKRKSIRARLGIGEDEVVFLNIGGALWNKGADVLLRAFAALRQNGLKARLFFKDQSGLYGVKIEQTVRDTAESCPELLKPETISAISVISDNLNNESLHELYNLADCYVSPYRAEGFNLPVLEAIASGLPVIVTAGGATDDFCKDGVAVRIPGVLMDLERQVKDAGGRYIEPNLDALIIAMTDFAKGKRLDPARYAAAREAVLSTYNWRNVSRQLASLVLRRPLVADHMETATYPATAQFPQSLPRVNSFDVFDTLIARRCIEPWNIFAQVGQKSGRPDFLHARIRAEAALAGQDYKIEDIYLELGKAWELNVEQTASLMNLEIETELENVIPIAEHMRKPAHGDLLISDMYLREDMIRTLLGKAGFQKRCGLIVTTRGKREGQIWPRVKTHFSIDRHLGDNEISDVTMPGRFGVSSEHTRTHEPDMIENWLIQQGLRSLALLARDARLQSWHPDPDMRGLQKIQVQLNLPILLLSSIQLMRVAVEINATHLLFCSRDCDLWVELFSSLSRRANVHLSHSYFFTSRIARLKPSVDYLSYARRAIGDGGLIVDSCGTGWSLSQLFTALGMSGQHGFFIHKCQPMEVYEEHKPTIDNYTVHTVIQPDRPIPNVGIEMVNTSEHGTVLDVRRVGDSFAPTFGKPFDSPRLQEGIRVQRQAFMDGLAILNNHDVSDLFTLPPDKIAVVVQALYEHLHTKEEIRNVFQQGFCNEAIDVHRSLGIRLTTQHDKP